MERYGREYAYLWRSPSLGGSRPMQPALTRTALMHVLHPRVIAGIESGAVAGPICSICRFLLIADGRRESHERAWRPDTRPVPDGVRWRRLGRSKTCLTNDVGPDVSTCLRRAGNGLLPLIPWGTKQQRGRLKPPAHIGVQVYPIAEAQCVRLSRHIELNALTWAAIRTASG